MSENLSIDEIIKRAEKIKAQAEKQLLRAEKKLDEKAKTAMDEVTVDEKAVVEKIAKVCENMDADEDVKEFVMSKPFKPFIRSKKVFKKDDNDDEDIKIASNFSITADEKTKRINLSEKSDDDVIIAKEKKSDEKTKPVAFVSNAKLDEKSDLQEIPTIVAREHIYDGFDGPSQQTDDNQEEIGVQIKFDGFDDVIESVPTIDEGVAEQILKERRREKVGKFRLFGPDETDMELGSRPVREDYVNKSEKNSFLQNLLSKKAALKIKIALSSVLTILLLLITVFKDSAYFPSFLLGHTAYFSFAAILYAAALIINLNVIIHGFNIKKRINFDFPISILSILILVHTVMLIPDKSLWIDNGVLLAAEGAFALLMSQLGKHRMMKRIIDNFDFITDSNEKYTVENIVNAVDAEIISRGLIEDDEPLIKTSVKTDFPTNFLEISYKNEPADRIARRIFPVAFLLSVTLFIAIGIIDNFNTAFNAALCAITIAVPCCTLFLTNTMLCDISGELKHFGSRVCGCEGAAMAHNANAMVMEAADLFGRNSCEMHGIKTFNGAKVDDAILQAAAVMMQTKSPLANVFDNVIIGKQSILPKVEGITYEDKMGTSAWIYKRKVLVGNRDLLLHHGVSVPKESFENKYTIKGRKALYLAVNGKITAMFVVSYNADPDLKRELRKLEKSGITIIVKSSDPYINEKSIAKLFALPEGFIRVMNYSAARVYDKYSNMNVEKSPAYIVHDGTALGFVSAMRASEIIVSSKNIISFLTFFGNTISFAAVALLSVLGAYTQISALSIILFQIIWNFFIFIVSKLRGIGL